MIVHGRLAVEMGTELVADPDANVCSTNPTCGSNMIRAAAAVNKDPRGPDNRSPSKVHAYVPDIDVNRPGIVGDSKL